MPAMANTAAKGTREKQSNVFHALAPLKPCPCIPIHSELCMQEHRKDNPLFICTIY